MANGFREFISRGNVIGLAVAVIIGATFTGVVSSLTDDLLMPVIGWLVGDLDFSNYFIRLGDIPAGYVGDPNNYAALKAAGVPMIGYGQFVGAAVNFLVVALLIYLLVRALKKAIGPAPSPAAAEPADVLLLREILGELRRRNDGSGPAL